MKQLDAGNLDEAERRFREALTIAESDNDLRELGTTHLNLANVASTRKDWPTASKHYQTAIDQLSQCHIQPPRELELSLRQYAAVCMIQERYSEVGPLIARADALKNPNAATKPTHQ